MFFNIEQNSLEDRFEMIAKMSISWNQKAVILCDRGLLDGKAYMSSRLWEMMLSDYNLNEVQLRDKRYLAVFHLISCADGAEQFYNLDNGARHESLEDARALDKKTQAAWSGHRNRIIIDNYTSFPEKLAKLLTQVIEVIENPDD